MIDESILPSALNDLPRLRGIRRDLHQHPEIGFNEIRTAGIIAKELSALGFEVATGIGKTGVVGILQGNQAGSNALVRFDMDALPIQEESGVEYASQNPGLMHACGHDGHVAIGLGVAKLLAERKDRLPGTVQLVFQPAEEGLGGARMMLDEGVLKIGPKADYALGVHVWNDMPLGTLVINPGALMSGAEIFWIKISGKGGHGASPHQTIDPVAAAAQWISAVQTIVSRNVSPLESAVVSVTSIHGGDTFNVIPQNVVLQGTIRTFQPHIRSLVLERFETLLKAVVEGMGCSAELKLTPLTAAVINDPKVTAEVQQVAKELFPDDAQMNAYLTMGSEDMADFLREIPGCYVMVGSANKEKGPAAAHHHPKFDFDENVLPRAAALVANAVLHLNAKER